MTPAAQTRHPVGERFRLTPAGVTADADHIELAQPAQGVVNSVPSLRVTSKP